jgi:hypothetical protein
LYHVLTTIYRVRPSLAFDFVAYTRQLGDNPDRGIDFDRIRLMFEYMENPASNGSGIDKPFTDDLVKHPLLTDPDRQFHIVVLGHLEQDLPSLVESNLEAWRDHYEVEQASSLARQMYLVDSVLAKPAGHPEIAVGSTRGPITELRNV